MLISPEVYFEIELKDMTLAELIKFRQKIIREMYDFERKYILKTKIIHEEIIMCPSPDVIYWWNSEILGLLNNLIYQKYKLIKDKKLV